MDNSEFSSPLGPLCNAWLSKIRLGLEFKRDRFMKHAEKAMFFFKGPYDDIYGNKRADYKEGFVVDNSSAVRKPHFGMTINKVSEMVQLFGPALYHRNPTRQVNPRKTPDVPVELYQLAGEDPAAAVLGTQVRTAVDSLRASLLESYLNYTPEALNLKSECRMAIDEAIITGMGVLEHSLYHPPGNPNLAIPGSFYVPVRDVVWDPDYPSRADAKWVARRCCHPWWEVEEEYGLAPGSVRRYAGLESYGRQAEVLAADRGAGDHERQKGRTNDLVVYWKIWSRMGLGSYLSGEYQGSLDKLRPSVEVYGKNVFLAVLENCPYPLNIRPDLIDSGTDEDVFAAVQWPTPFWMDDAWPFTAITFHEIPGEMYPLSHLRPAIGYLLFLNWAYSFLASKVTIATRDFIAVAKSAAEDIKRQIAEGDDYTVLEIETIHGTIDSIVGFLQHPPFQGDIYTVIQAVEMAFEKAVGLTELMYGTSRVQMRSAEEASAKKDMLSIRPDDMANKVEEAMTEAARKEALMARWHLDPQNHIAPIMGQEAARWWGVVVTPARPTEVLHQMEYRIEAGSARKPNKDRDVANAQQLMQVALPVASQYGMASMDFEPINNIFAIWEKANDVAPGTIRFKPPPPPPPPDPNNPPPPSPEEQDAMARQQQMQSDRQASQAELEVQMRRAQLDQAAREQELIHKERAHRQEVVQSEQKHIQNLLQAAEKARLDREKARAGGRPQGNGAK